MENGHAHDRKRLKFTDLVPPQVKGLQIVELYVLDFLNDRFPFVVIFVIVLVLMLSFEMFHSLMSGHVNGISLSAHVPSESGKKYRNRISEKVGIRQLGKVFSQSRRLWVEKLVYFKHS